MRSIVFVLLLFPACQQLPPAALPETVLPEAGRSDPRLLHARELEAWRSFDANLDMLHRARRYLKRDFVLPESPSLENQVEVVAWAAAQAMERRNLADMRCQETLNDLEHCRQALALAEAQVVAASAAQREVLTEFTPALAKLRQVLSARDSADKRVALDRFARTLPDLYRSSLLGLAETTQRN